MSDDYQRSAWMPDLAARNLSYELPDERIARYPLPQRDQSKLLVWSNGKITDSRFGALARFIPAGSLLIFNNTKVIRARLPFQKTTGAKIEVFCLDPEDPEDYQMSFSQTGQCTWNCMVGNLKKWKDEVLTRVIEISGAEVVLKAEKISQREETVQVRFSWSANGSHEAIVFADITEAAGILPVPPYLRRETEPEDIERYQTIYSRIQGSVAAPTAGLHFTEEVFASLRKNNVGFEELTLHVGAGTFRPIKSTTIADHKMHSERVEADRELIRKLMTHPGKIVAIGTTSVRSLESLYRLGVKLTAQPHLLPEELTTEQWEPYPEKCCNRVRDHGRGHVYESRREEKRNMPAGFISADEADHADLPTREEAMQAVLSMMEKHNLLKLSFPTSIMIVPGYRFRITEAMVTNFHQPQSTLLLLIAAFIGDGWKQVYDHALANDYRFLSYGDSSLLMRE